ncbi:acyltransferase family protein [Bowmanella dokdonensis]|uniref:Acyltransferase family protein n=1 Tax=Bowmanella dokdonensis TaxID=751969 RepID=A0A939DQB1_9ALTE|nr:acyltransferase family protein [Bowmanella dokdonensis]MBN7826255.1 acyltransferase family protein [Bowmanella dokdonensis]
MTQARENWIDGVKGLTISLVVLHHVLMGINAGPGFPEGLMEIYLLTTPIRMPLFFLVAGFFARQALTSDLAAFVDKKVLYFAYFFLLWNSISVVSRYLLGNFTNNQVELAQLGRFLWEPSYTLWFLYALLLAFSVARLTRSVPFWLQLAGALLLAFVVGFGQSDALPYVFTGTIRFYPFFLCGCYGSTMIRRAVRSGTWSDILCFTVGYLGLAFLAYRFFAVANPLLYYPMAILSSAAIMCLVCKLDRTAPGRLLQYVGERSLPIYLMHFIPAAGVRVVATKLGFADYPVMILLVGTPVAILACLGVNAWLKRTPRLTFLIRRPDWCHYRPASRQMAI